MRSLKCLISTSSSQRNPAFRGSSFRVTALGHLGIIALVLSGCASQQYQTQIAELQNQVTELRKEMDALKVVPAPAGNLISASQPQGSEPTPTTTSTPAPANSAKVTEGPKSTTPTTDIDFAALEKSVEKEKRDGKWARLREGALMKLFVAHIKQTGASLNTVSCRTTMCRAVVMVPQKRVEAYKPFANVWAGTPLLSQSRVSAEKVRFSYLFKRHEKDQPELGAERVDPLKLGQTNPELIEATQFLGAAALPVKAPAAEKPGVAKPTETKKPAVAKVAEPKQPAEPSKPAEPKKAAEPKKPAEPKKATEPTKPAPTKAADPVKPAAAKPVEASKPAAKTPKASKPTDKAADATKPAETKPVEAAKPVEAKPVDAKPVETKPVDVKPAAKATKTSKAAEKSGETAKPVEAKPVDAKPAAAKPVETKPVDAKPAAAKPVEAKPVDTKPAAPKPVETKPSAAPAAASAAPAVAPSAKAPTPVPPKPVPSAATTK